MRFFNFSQTLGDVLDREPTFDLQSGLISALYEFSRCLSIPIDSIRFKQSESKHAKSVTKDGMIVYDNPYYRVEYEQNTDLIITIQCDAFLFLDALESKVLKIFEETVQKYVPILPNREFTKTDEEEIIYVLENKLQVSLVNDKINELQKTCESFLSEFAHYGLEDIVITSFDLDPIIRTTIKEEDLKHLLRDIERFPSVGAYKWGYRAGRFYSNVLKWIYVINSGVGPEYKGLQMHYYYLLITKEGSFLGDSPFVVCQTLNEIMLE